MISGSQTLQIQDLQTFSGDTVARSVPTAGATVNMGNGQNSILLLDPAGTLATLTVVLPVNPSDGDRATISTSQILTALTITGTIVGTLTTLALSGFASFKYNQASAKWFRVG